MTEAKTDWFIDKKEAKYLFKHINTTDYRYPDIFTPFIGGSHQDSGIFKEDDVFEDNIQIIFYEDKGDDNNETDFFLCGIWKNKDFVYINAHCDNTGFNCQGEMKLYADNSLERLSTFAMDDKSRKLLTESAYMKGIEAAKKALERKICKDMGKEILKFL